ncbi:MAG: hypothetical protein EX260_01840 [Desulfobulbaceae bacterium]|nr:hypothetical protein [Desulfofustis sp.]RZW26046.1 MAG: hypothetical protein EX260_01840 [Desulfobulbaceae bacterium]
MRTAILVVFAISVFLPAAFAGEYTEVVSTYDNDFYKIDTKNILIRTENCLEDVQAQEVLLSINGTAGEITFTETDNRCAVQAVLGTSGYRVGNYRVDITREEENWYKITDQDIYIRTEECLIYATEQEGLLSVSTVGKGGSGSLHFEGEACRVIGLYRPMEL